MLRNHIVKTKNEENLQKSALLRKKKCHKKKRKYKQSVKHLNVVANMKRHMHFMVT